jgi:hypothetical protein
LAQTRGKKGPYVFSASKKRRQTGTGRRPGRPSSKFNPPVQESIPLPEAEPTVEVTTQNIEGYPPVFNKYFNKKYKVYKEDPTAITLKRGKKEYLFRDEYTNYISKENNEIIQKMEDYKAGKVRDSDWHIGWYKPKRQLSKEAKALQKALDKYYARPERIRGETVKIKIKDTPFFTALLCGELGGIEVKDPVELTPEQATALIDNEKALISNEEALKKTKTKYYVLKRHKLYPIVDDKGIKHYVSAQDKYDQDYQDALNKQKKLQEDFRVLESQANLPDYGRAVTQTIKDVGKLAEKTAIQAIAPGYESIRGLEEAGSKKIVKAASERLHGKEVATTSTALEQKFKEQKTELPSESVREPLLSKMAEANVEPYVYKNIYDGLDSNLPAEQRAEFAANIAVYRAKALKEPKKAAQFKRQEANYLLRDVKKAEKAADKAAVVKAKETEKQAEAAKKLQEVEAERLRKELSSKIGVLIAETRAEKNPKLKSEKITRLASLKDGLPAEDKLYVETTIEEEKKSLAELIKKEGKKKV